MLQYLLNSFHLFIFCLWWKVSWTHALRQIVINCYKYHGREDLLPAFSEDATEETSRPAKVIKTETEAEQQVDQTGDATTQQQSTPQQQQQQQQQPAPPPSSSQPAQHQQQSVQQLVQASPSNAAQYAPTVVQTISNPDGTVSIIQVGFSLSSILTFLIWFRCSCFLFFFSFFFLLPLFGFFEFRVVVSSDIDYFSFMIPAYQQQFSNLADGMQTWVAL